VRRLSLLAAPLVGLLACGPHRIPGTDLEDNGDTRAIIDVMQKYNNALVAKDAGAILDLVDPTFRDTGGTLTPEDDLDYAKLKSVLPQRLARLNDIALKMDIKTIDVKGDLASAVYTWVSSFKLANRSFTESDIKRMDFRRTASGWKILSGI
jgi:hypothetical protein